MKQVLHVFQLFVWVIAISAMVEASYAAPNWTQLARKVGISETEAERLQAIAALRADTKLSSNLIAALDSDNRLLALDVIVALSMREMVPELLSRITSDEDGFLTLNLNALLEEKNKDLIFSRYQEILKPAEIAQLSPAAIVAMLEPLGRAGFVLPRASVDELFRQAFPEVRAAVIYYVRMLALRHSRRDHVRVLSEALRAGEFQIRLQAISTLLELTRSSGRPPVTREKLTRRCEKESHPKVKRQCFWILDNPGSVP
ncbi:MAG: hypothetical protein NDI61_13500 [Bdellovibrionaceae bacterium]|nr:hypothetical protein [Pseudobdellovibrionaceae bacterium]